MDAILVINAGSSSVKFSLFGVDERLPQLAHGEVSNLGNRPVFSAFHGEAGAVANRQLEPDASAEDGLRAIIDWILGHEDGLDVVAVAHRIVHGGGEFSGPVRVTPDILRQLEQLCPLAPLHQPHNLAALGIVDRLLTHAPQIACFDTAFHALHEPLFRLYALPQDLMEKGVRRYGFHGLSYEWISLVLKREHPELARGRVIAAHLGNGASICAMRNGKSIDTTMGMTVLDGLPMGTRSGALDPGAVLYMINTLGIPAAEVEHVLYEQSGLKGLSGQTNDVRALLASDDPRARFALDYFALRVAQYMAMLAVSIGGVDGVVFTGGIGENAAPVRDAVMKHLGFLDVPCVLVIPADEERVMALQALGRLGRHD